MEPLSLKIGPLICLILILMGCELEKQNGPDAGRGGVDQSEPFECSGAFLASFPEACNGFDDDCDGSVDEGIVSCDVPRKELPFKFCNTDCCLTDAACAEGEVCETLGTQGRCVPPCEDGELRLCSFGCEPTFQACVGQVWAPCESNLAGAELCNQRDDDCDGLVDESPECGSIDMGFIQDQLLPSGPDAEVEDAGIVIDASLSDMSVDASVVDAEIPVEPECRSHGACPSFQLCFNGACRSALPGTYNVIIYSARIGDLPGDSPDMFAELKLGNNLIGTTETIDDDESPSWNYRVRTRLESQQILELCVWDEDGFLNGNDLAGCSQFSSETIVEAIRTFRGTRINPNWATFSPQITSGTSLDSVFLHVDRL
tara:strand:+ start:954 stop:2069 length:1116 start_codon:yes stop_codon:yes gene_type:complete